MPNVTLGIRNNNPFNLKATNISWQGEIGVNDGFEVFSTVEYGLRAGLMDLLHDRGEGQNTIHSLIMEFAPPSENDTTAFINSVSNDLGIAALQELPKSKNLMLNLARAIIKVENGANHTLVTDTMLNTAWGMVPVDKKIGYIETLTPAYTNFGFGSAGIMILFILMFNN